MKGYVMTCNNMIDLWRERVHVTAKDMDEAWIKAKKKAQREHGGKIADIEITTVESEEKND